MATTEELLATIKQAQQQLLAALQAEFFCDDLEPPEEAFGWSHDKLRSFMESGGAMVDVADSLVDVKPTQTTLATEQPPSWGWGLFCSALAPSKFSRPEAATLVTIDGKLPVASKGPIVWLEGAPDEAVTPDVASTATIVPVGDGKSKAHAVALTGESDMCATAEKRVAAQCPNGFKWVTARDIVALPSMRRATTEEVEAVVRAVSLLSWHKAHAYSGADGRPTSFAPGTLGRRRKLESGRSVYPRVDPVAIVLVVSADGERVLLGRQKSYPPGMFTCISGFVEHGESAERAAAREALEETGVCVASAELVASQPWPCGRGASCELMLAVIGRAEAEGEAIDVGGEGGGPGELEEARWFDRPAVTKMLRATPGGSEAWVPPAFAIANHLMARWEQGWLRVPGLP